MGPDLVPATGATLEEILDETHPVWGEGLDRAGYARYNRAQLATPWGRDHLRRVALVEGGRWVSTAKCYDLRARLRGREVGVLGIGAVFTRPGERRRGAAGEVMRRVMDAGAASGASLALLFSEIGAGYYQRFGFRPVPVTQLVVAVADTRRAAAAPAIAMRSGEPRDLAAIAQMNERQTAGFPFALVRSPEYVAFAITKKRLLAACGPAGRREVEFLVVEEGGRAAAYVVVLEVGEYWVVTECGDRDPTGARVGALLQAMLARGGRRSVRIIAWLPPGFLPPQLRILWQEKPTIVMMTAPLGGLDLAPPPGGDALAWWHGDAF